MVYTIEELKSIIAPIAQKYDIPAVYLFGSYARGDATEDSDVDVLIQREGSTIRGIIMGSVYEDLQESLKKEVDLVTVESLSQFADRRGAKRFAGNLLKERKIIYERS
jgi:predicted nucleotidyltransferase